MSISVRNVSKVYQAATASIAAVSDVTLDAKPGEFISILGPSGCGKSTLLMMLAGLEPVSSGSIIIDDHLVDSPRQEFGLVFQDPTLLPWLTAEQNVLFPIRMMRRDVSAYRQRARDLLARVGLSHALDRRPREMSGGMRQRVALCRSLIHDPSRIFMDEPFSALDALTRDEMAQILLKLWDADGVGVARIGLFVTHSIREAVLLSDRILVMGRSPSRIKADITVPFARPRNPEVQESVEFNALVAEVRQLIDHTIQ